MVFRREAGTVEIDQLRRDLISRRFPGWQLTGNRYAIRASEAPASVGLARCVGQVSGSFAPLDWSGCRQDSIVFGQINLPTITSIEVLYEDSWKRFPVSAPGYVVSLAPFDGLPQGYRWLDRSGDIVYEREAVPELLWD